LAPGADGLSLQAGSPGIDAGSALATAYAGAVNSRPRPVGAAWDIGAYENASGMAADPSPNPPFNLTLQ
jgi:hypothetical protein